MEKQSDCLETGPKPKRANRFFEIVLQVESVLLAGALAYHVYSGRGYQKPQEISPAPVQIEEKIVPATKTKAMVKVREKLNYNVPILMYHQITKKTKNRYCLPADEFKKQLDWINKNHYKAMTMKKMIDFYGFETEKDRDWDKVIMLTFDDLDRNFYENAYPLLKNYEMGAVGFVIVDWISEGNKPYKNELTWDQLNEMNEGGLVEFGSHTIGHGYLTRLSKKKMKYELEASKRKLDENLYLPVRSIAWPYGSANKRVRKFARKAGYAFFFGCDEFRKNKVKMDGNPPLRDEDLGRLEVKGTWDIKRFENAMHTYVKLLNRK